jgi:putative transposase
MPAKLAARMDEAEADVLAYMSFPPAHRPKLHPTNPIERLNAEQVGMAEAYSPRSASQDAIASASGPVLWAKMCPSMLGGRGLGSST